MNRLLKDLNDAIVRKSTPASGEDASFDTLQIYRSLLENGGTIEVKFLSADSEGTHLAVDDNGVHLKMLREDMKLNSYQKRTGSMLGTNLAVSVKEVDDATNTVYLSMSKKKNTYVSSINKAIQEDLNKGNPVRLFGTVIKVFPPQDNRSRERAWVRLLDQDVIGSIDVKDWGKGFTRKLADVCQVGEKYEFEVVGNGPMGTINKTNNPIWRLSRKNIAADPWDSIPAEFVENSVILIKAVEKPKDKSYFWGESPLAPGIDIMCNYPARLHIVEGAYYKCKIDRLDVPGKFFRVAPFEICSTTSLSSVDLKKEARRISRDENFGEKKTEPQPEKITETTAETPTATEEPAEKPTKNTRAKKQTS